MNKSSKMITYDIKLTAISPIVMTSRENQQLIKDIDFETKDSAISILANKKEIITDSKTTDNITIIYDGYYNGEKYYIPGSTIKGNLLKNIQEKRKYGENMVVSDFILFEEKYLKITNSLTKVMYQQEIKKDGTMENKMFQKKRNV